MRKNIKRSAAIIMTGLVLLTGCKSSSSDGGETSKPADVKSETVFSEEMSKLNAIKVGDVTITQAEYYLYLMQFIYNQGLKASDITDKVTENAIDSTIYQIRLDQVLAQMAKKEEAVNVTDEDLSTMRSSADSFYNYFGKALLDEYFITKDMIYSLFETQAYVSAMNDKIITDLSKSLFDSLDEQYKDYTFHNMYYCLFPSYETDESGNPKTSSDGKTVSISEEQKNENKKKAQELREKAVSGEKMEDLAKEYGIEAFSGNQINYNGAYSDELNELVASLKDGDISEVFDTESGYMVVRMDKAIDNDYRNYWLQYTAYQKAQENISTMQQKMVESAGLKETDINDYVMTMTDLKTLCERMNAHGVKSANN